MISVTLKYLFVKTFWFQEKGTPETYTVEFVERNQVTVVQSFFQCWPVLWLLQSIKSEACADLNFKSRIMGTNTKTSQWKQVKCALSQKLILEF